MNVRMGLFATSMAIGSALLFGCENAQRVNPADQGTAIRHIRCTAEFSDATIAPVLDGSAIESVQPIYIASASKTSDARLQGAAIIVVPAKGETAERLDRALECHQAQPPAVEATGATVRPDPFGLPGTMAQIDVTSARDGFRIEVTGSSSVAAREILARAQARGPRKAKPPTYADRRTAPRSMRSKRAGVVAGPRGRASEPSRYSDFKAKRNVL
jgi:hypothetical protein